MTEQGYVSMELTHFVGRALSSDEQRYELLLRILNDGDGWLLADPQQRIRVEPQYQEDTFTLEMVASKDLTEDVSQPAYQPQAVCFCDIPIKDLGIHMEKYGRFGLAFLKPFLIEKGASPVFYVAKNSIPRTTRLHGTRESYFQEGFERYQKLWLSTVRPGGVDSFFVHRFLAFHVFGFIKFFDDAAPENDYNNFYMEREWRVLGNVHFGLDAVHRVLLPESYGQRFRADLPDFSGILTYAEQLP